MKCLRNFRTLKKVKFEEFFRIEILNNPEVYIGETTADICIVDLNEFPDEPYGFTYPGLPFVTAMSLDVLKEYVLRCPVFYLKKDENSDSAIAVPKEQATHVLRLPADTKVENLVINGNEVLMIDRKGEVKKETTTEPEKSVEPETIKA